MNINYCQVGTPVQFMMFRNGGYSQYPALINYVCDSDVRLLVFMPGPVIIKDVRHVDFYKEGCDFWQYIAQEHPPKCKDGIPTVKTNKSNGLKL